MLVHIVSETQTDRQLKFIIDIYIYEQKLGQVGMSLIFVEGLKIYDPFNITNIFIHILNC